MLGSLKTLSYFLFIALHTLPLEKAFLDVYLEKNE